VDLLLFAISSKTYGIEVGAVKELVNSSALKFTKIPQQHDAVSGIVNIRNTVITVVDGGRVFGNKLSNNYILVIEDKKTKALVGLLVDNVIKIVNNVSTFKKKQAPKVNKRHCNN